MPKRSKPPKLPPKEIIDSYFDEFYEAITQDKHLTEEVAKFFRTQLNALEKRKDLLRQHQPHLKLTIRNCLIIILVERLIEKHPEADRETIFELASNHQIKRRNRDIKPLRLSDESIRKIYYSRDNYLWDEWADSTDEELDSLLDVFTSHP